MEGKENKSQEKAQAGEQNSTINAPGSKVADYGKTTEEASLDKLEQKHGMQSDRQGNSSIPLDNDETIGNP